MFKIGDTVYIDTCENHQKELVCPICDGKKEVTLILGAGDSVIMLCNYCVSASYYPPTGKVHEWAYEPYPRSFPITGMEISIEGDKEIRRYKSDCTIYDEDRCFATREEALESAIARKKKQEEDQKSKQDWIKMDKNKSYSSNAGRHMAEAKRNREQAEYHEKMAKLCKNLAREQKKEVTNGKL